MKKARALLTLTVGPTIAALCFACSGVDSDLFSATDNGGSGSTDAGTDAARTTRDAGKSDGGGTGGSGDAGVKPIDSGLTGSVVPAVCGASTTCSSSDPTCCATQSTNGITPTSYTCTPGPSSCGSGGATSPLPVLCRDDSDCTGGKLCCGELVDATGTGGYQSVSCESSCAPKDGANLSSHVIFCASTTTTGACAAAGLTCTASAILPGFIVCGGD